MKTGGSTKFSIVTAARDRTDQLIRTVTATSKLQLHFEHIIVDWGSDPPIDKAAFPPDPRLKITRVQNVQDWWLTQAYNVGFSLTTGDYVIKLDADCSLSNAFELFIAKTTDLPSLSCNRLTLQDWRLNRSLFLSSGFFMVKRDALSAVRGFNPYIKGWGWDEVDLFSRIFLAGGTIRRFPPGQIIEEIAHGPELRVRTPNLPSIFHVHPNDLKELINFKNEKIALFCVETGVSWPSLAEYKRLYETQGATPEISASLSACLGNELANKVIDEMATRAVAFKLGGIPAASLVARLAVISLPRKLWLEWLKKLRTVEKY
jgi:hypothetical protein